MRTILTAIIAGVFLSANIMAQCYNDSECKGDRICVNGQCVERSDATATQPETPATDQQIPAEETSVAEPEPEPEVAAPVVSRTESSSEIKTERSGMQTELGFALGYGFPAGRNNTYGGNTLAEYEETYNSVSGTYSYNKYKDVYFSMGNGLKIDLDLNLFFNDNVGLHVGAGTSFIGGTRIEMVSTSSTSTSEDTAKIRSNHFLLNIGLKFKSNLGAVQPYAYIAPALFIPFASKVTEEYAYKSASSSTSSTTEIKLNTTAGFGFASALGMAIMLSKNVGLKIEAAPVFAFVRIQEIEIEFDDGSTETIIFEKNKDTLPSDITTGNAQKTYEHGGPTISLSSIAARIGMVFCF